MFIVVSNVNEALYRGVQLLASCRNIVAPRGMRTLEHPTPVVTEYHYPTDRVLFHPERDANPFFHLFEALWMLAGRDDVKFLRYFNKRMELYSDDGTSLHGAYGYRWRFAFKYDQIETAVRTLMKDKSSRRCVIGMYSPILDGKDYEGKDVPCNTQIYLKVRNEALNLTVTCRSNDILWGAYGANAVQFSMLQEYIAAKVGVAVGRMWQLSDSYHAYLDGDGGALWDKLRNCGDLLGYDYYKTGKVTAVPLVAPGEMWAFFDMDLQNFFQSWDLGGVDELRLSSKFFQQVVIPMFVAFKHRDPSVLSKEIDWHVAGREWLTRRAMRSAAKQMMEAKY